jgi:DNA-binding PadR family transcriptional regulator
MSRTEIALLGYALLGLLHQKPASGYDLRKIFTETPMAGYSDSPGAIYPALRRLEEQKLVRGTIEAGSGLRRRKVFSVTAAGMAALTKWLTSPFGQEDVAKRLNELMLRFAFLDQVAGEAATLRFLESYEGVLKLYVPTLREFLKNHGASMPASGRLALENGTLGYEAQLEWASRAINFYKNREKAR